MGALGHSIRWRLQAWHGFLLALILAGFGTTAHQLHRNYRLRFIDGELRFRTTALSGEVRRQMSPSGWDRHAARPPVGDSRLSRRHGERGSNDADGAAAWTSSPVPGQRTNLVLPSRALQLFQPSETRNFHFAIWSPSGELMARSSNAAPDLVKPEAVPSGRSVQYRIREEYREAFAFTSLGHCILSGHPIEAELEAIRGFGWLLLAAGLAVLGLGLGGGWLIASDTLRPIHHITEAARRISAGHLAERMALPGAGNELRELATVLNSTFARLDAAFAQQRQFTADASHELRTPIAVLLTEVQSTLARARSAEEYRGALQSCLETALQMKQLTDSLLQLARYDSGQETLERQEVALDERVRHCVERLTPLTRSRRIGVVLELVPCVVQGDPGCIDQVMTNLLANAIQYNREGGTITVAMSANLSPPGATLTIADTGCGIPAEDCDLIFKRFYRADKARHRRGGHSGLGLAISKAIVDAHHGTIHVESTPGHGSTFTVWLPA